MALERRTASTVMTGLLTLSMLVSALHVVPDVTGNVWMSSDWSQVYGGTDHDYAWSVVETNDGGYAIAGYTWSYGAGSADFWLVKTDSAGNALWNQTYGGARSDVAYSMVQTSDEGYALAGHTNSYGPGAPTYSNFWLVKTNATGNVLWNQTYGGTGADGARFVVQTNDGGYAIAGYTDSFGAGSYDFWLVKTDSAGTMLWNQTYGGTNIDRAYSVVETSDGGYAIAGHTNSYDTGNYDFWLVKTNATGNVLWNQTYGGTNLEDAYSVVQTIDGGYALAGYTNFGAGGVDFWLVKTDSAGNALWNQTYGGTSADMSYSVVQTIDGGYALAGYTNFGAGGVDFWLVKTDSAGNALWNQTYGGTNNDVAYSMVQTSDEGYALAGYTNSYGPGAPTYSNFWLVKVTPSTIYIRADGSIDPPSAPILRDGNVYTLNDTIYTGALEGIVIQRSNTILDGAGYMLQGSGCAQALTSAGIRVLDVSNVTVKNLNISSFDFAIYIEDSPDNIIQANSATDCDVGIFLRSSSNTVLGNSMTRIHNCTIILNSASYNSIQENVMTYNDGYGIWLYGSHHNNITGNTITATGAYCFYSGSSLNTTLIGNNMRDSYGGIRLQSSPGSFVYHNNFINNSVQAYTYTSPSFWDDGYPSGGNHWSDYAGSDFFSGPYQNLTGSDGIGDDHYVIDEDNRDSYPLMEPWEAGQISTRYGWPMFRCNVERNGYTRSPGPSTLQELWNYTTSDAVISSPAVVGRRVYVGSRDRNVYCLDALTGDRIWLYPTGGLVHSSPAVANDRVYVGSYDGNLYCLLAATGEWIWNYTTGWRVSSSPVVVNGKVYVGSWDNKTYCLNAETGAYLWSYTTGGLLAPSSPAVAYGRVFVGSSDGIVYCLNAETGAFLWSYGTGGGVFASPVVADGRVYVGSGDNKTYCLSVETGERIWNYTTSGSITSSCAYADGRVYVGSGDGRVYCLNAETGGKIWNYTTSGNVTYSSPAIALGRVYIGSDDNKIYCLDALTGAYISSFTTGDYIWSSPAIADNVVYVGSNDGSVYAFGSVIKVPDDYPTIQDAIDAASPGDTIVIAPGVYNESIVINKRLTIIGQKGSSTTFAGGGYGVAITISGSDASGSIIAAVTITNYAQGILVDNSANCRIYDNIMYLMGDSGIVLEGTTATSNIIYGNTIYGNNIGINLTETSPSNIIYSNTISQNAIGIKLSSSSGNIIYMNSFIDNTVQAMSNPSTNAWDNGYPTGGNYWSNYVGVDIKNGPEQDLDGPDGIIDTPYELSPSNVDNYPRMKPHDWIPPLGDINHDGTVNHDDLDAFSNAYGSILGMPNWNQNCDFQKNNKIEVMDLYHLGKNYGSTPP